MSRHATLKWIPQTARRLETQGALRGRAWSLAQVCEHLALAFEGTVRDPADPGPPQSWRVLGPWRRFQRRCAKYGLLATGWFPKNVPSPEVVVPSIAPQLAEAIERLEAAIEAFEQKLARPTASWVYHPLLGRMSGRQWRRFHAIHAAHHFGYFQRKQQGSSRQARAVNREPGNHVKE